MCKDVLCSVVVTDGGNRMSIPGRAARKGVVATGHIVSLNRNRPGIHITGVSDLMGKRQCEPLIYRKPFIITESHSDILHIGLVACGWQTRMGVEIKDPCTGQWCLYATT